MSNSPHRMAMLGKTELVGPSTPPDRDKRARREDASKHAPRSARRL
jgi:hypothetical protein